MLDDSDVLDVWAFDVDDKDWHLVGPYEAGDFCALAFSSGSKKAIIYNPYVGLETECCSVQTWAFDIRRNTWQNMEPSEQPPARTGSRMVYDAESDRMVLFGGADLFTFELQSDTWAYDHRSNTWTNLRPPNSPPGLFFYDMVYHQAQDKIVLFGGFSNTDATELSGGTWAFDFNTNAWTEINSAASPAPRAYHTLAYEKASKKIVMFGGILDGSAWPEEPTIDETWVFDLKRASWTQQSPEKVATSRAWHQMVGIGNGVLLFGGGPSRFEYNSDTHAYSSRANRWNLVSPCDDDD